MKKKEVAVVRFSTTALPHNNTNLVGLLVLTIQHQSCTKAAAHSGRWYAATWQYMTLKELADLTCVKYIYPARSRRCSFQEVDTCKCGRYIFILEYLGSERDENLKDLEHCNISYRKVAGSDILLLHILSAAGEQNVLESAWRVSWSPEYICNSRLSWAESLLWRAWQAWADHAMQI